ncbi:hypothetical protein VT84_12445 [Gemmata sp. SH-PL17]|uniref:hypothetical protein n=1 Tax=Gemmata sp. SH-PL17 TaxID=1630693 RepID=UPI00078B53E1|nr:hypothetical protein [Gemmata sp. SH-PL17]AMV25200.1 hypothetical protein VT84_12445 [Gemmata sp. SH-PL17]
MADENNVAGLVAPDGYPADRGHLLAAFDEQAKGPLARPDTMRLIDAMGGMLTSAAREGNWDELAGYLRRDLPVIFRRLGLELDLDTAILDLIKRCQTDLGDRRVTDMLPGWLDEYASQHGARPAARLAPEEIRTLIAATTAEDLIKQWLKEESAPWGRQVLDWLLRQDPDVLAGDLRAVTVPPTEIGAVREDRVRKYLTRLADELDRRTQSRLCAYRPSDC